MNGRFFGSGTGSPTAEEAPMKTHTEEKIRDRAYALWVAAGSPDGNEADFWHRAERELAEESGVDLSEDAAEISRPRPIAGGIKI